MTTELATALRRREPAAFARLLDEHGPMLYGLARRLTGRAGDAEDVVQECLVTAYLKIDTLRDSATLGGWLRRIVVNSALMRLRSRKREPALLPHEPEFTPDGRHARVIAGWVLPPEDAVLRHEALEVLGAAVARLPEAARVVYVLAEIHGLPHPETAELLGIAESTVRVRLHRARLALREALAGYFTEHRAAGGPARTRPAKPTAKEANP